ncbi:hypothetical protein BDN70DRAFT_337195 [Pholiota conissans]|uniref:Uncharacterized protein n=1 Tax=Pholiota conissans TaxID=109636 RepID=A0A9P5YQQ2_9AGAR|nr:hypothetical protein BDN70DRAFT_337195 [Pholiota conissans]
MAISGEMVRVLGFLTPDVNNSFATSQIQKLGFLRILRNHDILTEKQKRMTRLKEWNGKDMNEGEQRRMLNFEYDFFFLGYTHWHDQSLWIGHGRVA